MKSPEELTEAFRRQGLKVTPQRQCIFRALHRNPEHPSAESVYELVSAEMPTISLRTVYQTLNDLAAMGEVRQLALGTGSARFDPNLDAHHHLVCDRCGEVFDVYADVSGVEVAPDQRRGFTISTTQIVFRGLCAACEADPERSVRPDGASPSHHPSQHQHEETIHA